MAQVAGAHGPFPTHTSLGDPLSAGTSPWVQERLAGNLRNNAIRHDRVLEAYEQVARAFSSKGVEFVVLKGLAQWPRYCDDLRHRPQYDLDLYCPPSAIQRAFEAIRSLGYEPFGQKGRIAIDHLPPMIRMTGWRPNGDYYDPEMPLTIELHFRFWDQATERFAVDNDDGFWERRVSREVQGISMPTLDPVDGLSYTTWHLVRHLVRGDVRAYHVYELAHFLQKKCRGPHFLAELAGQEVLRIRRGNRFPACDRLVRLSRASMRSGVMPIATGIRQPLV